MRPSAVRSWRSSRPSPVTTPSIAAPAVIWMHVVCSRRLRAGGRIVWRCASSALNSSGVTAIAGMPRPGTPARMISVSCASVDAAMRARMLDANSPRLPSPPWQATQRVSKTLRPASCADRAQERNIRASGRQCIGLGLRPRGSRCLYTRYAGSYASALATRVSRAHTRSGMERRIVVGARRIGGGPGAGAISRGAAHAV